MKNTTYIYVLFNNGVTLWAILDGPVLGVEVSFKVVEDDWRRRERESAERDVLLPGPAVCGPKHIYVGRHTVRHDEV